jgi:hypothetical protein
MCSLGPTGDFIIVDLNLVKAQGNLLRFCIGIRRS